MKKNDSQKLKKLQLSRETLRNLGNLSAQKVVAATEGPAAEASLDVSCLSNWNCKEANCLTYSY